MFILETKRLYLRHFELSDAPFILQLVNEPAFIAYIGDKGIRNLDDATSYLVNGPLAMYDIQGFGLYHVALKTSGAAIGMCGLIKRAELEDVDIGFAFLEQFWGRGYAFESAAAVSQYGRTECKLARLVGITAPDNAGSIKVLKKLGMSDEGEVQLKSDAKPVKIFGLSFSKI